MDKLKYIIPLLFLLFGACSLDDRRDPLSLQDGEPLPIQFRTTVGIGENAEFESNYFEKGDEIRIYCPISYSTPNFEDGAPGTYIYTYSNTEGGTDNWPYKFQAEEGKGFDWRTLVPTSIYYVFEAMYFPGKEYLKEVPANQNELDMLEKADILIAHHRQSLDLRGKAVQLTFHHAFAMVQVKVKLPVSDLPTEGPFPKNAIEDVYMRAMLTGYEVNYSQVIDNDGLRTVGAPAADEALPSDTPGLRKDVHMRQISTREMIEDVNGKSIRFQEYVFQGIVPAQKFLNQGNEFLYFKVKKHDGGEPKLFKYVPEKSTLSLISSHVLHLSLEINTDLQDVVVLTAEIRPWGKARNDMEIGPEK